MADRTLLRLSATLLFIGLLVYFVANFLHPHRELPNNDPAVFTEYANSAVWTAVHLGQFVGTAVLIAGLLVLFFALNVSQGTPRWLGFFGAIAAGVALALAGVVYAVDGVTLKQAVDAWVSAPAAEQAARFASAEAIRWLEWGTRSYYNFMFGLTLVLFATTIVWTARITRPIGYVMGLIGPRLHRAELVRWELGASPQPKNCIGTMQPRSPSLSGRIWLLIVVWRMKEPVQAAIA